MQSIGLYHEEENRMKIARIAMLVASIILIIIGLTAIVIDTESDSFDWGEYEDQGSTRMPSEKGNVTLNPGSYKVWHNSESTFTGRIWYKGDEITIQESQMKEYSYGGEMVGIIEIEEGGVYQVTHDEEDWIQINEIYKGEKKAPEQFHEKMDLIASLGLSLGITLLFFFIFVQMVDHLEKKNEGREKLPALFKGGAFLTLGFGFLFFALGINDHVLRYLVPWNINQDWGLFICSGFFGFGILIGLIVVQIAIFRKKKNSSEDSP